MSFPSIAAIAREKGIDLSQCDPEDRQQVLLAAVKHDCFLAIEYLHKKAHEAQKSGRVLWSEDPNSPLGKQLIRVHASDAVRPLVEEHVCHGMQLTFVNCCNGVVAPPKPKDDDELVRLQIECQNGVVAYADC